MKRLISDVAFAVTVFLVIYCMIIIAFYQSDKQFCSKFGYSNTITPTFEGYCTREIDDGVTEIVPIENMNKLKLNLNQGTQGWRSEP